MELNTIYNIDCREGIKKIPDNFVHSIVTDPPHELGFMEKDWDRTGIAYDKEFWKECLRVLRPGGYLLVFSSCRTYHRVACAIEDAGFEIRDKIDYFHDNSQNIKAFIDSLSEEQKNAFFKILDHEYALGFLSWIYGQGYPKGLNIGRYIQKQIKNGKLSDAGVLDMWDGWNTALKPANEPICVARKPMSEKTILDNLLKWGTGGFNIDKNRIGSETIRTNGQRKGRGNVFFLKDYKSPDNFVGDVNTGRYPANVVLDKIAGEMLDEQSGILKSGSNCVKTRPGTFLEHGGLGKKGDVQVTYGDEGGASRFFYCAKASGKERGKYNNHPTVKPLNLIKHLVSLVTPVGGISLDPFMGSGTHAIACLELGVNYIGMEKGKNYYEISLRRIEEYKQKQDEKKNIKGR